MYSCWKCCSPLLAANLAKEIKGYLTKTDYVGHNENLYLNKNEKIDIETQKEKLSFIDLFSGSISWNWI